jgi:hypothetical protein
MAAGFQMLAAGIAFSFIGGTFAATSGSYPTTPSTRPPPTYYPNQAPSGIAGAVEQSADLLQQQQQNYWEAQRQQAIQVQEYNRRYLEQQNRARMEYDSRMQLQRQQQQFSQQYGTANSTPRIAVPTPPMSPQQQRQLTNQGLQWHQQQQQQLQGRTTQPLPAPNYPPVRR